MFQLSQKLDKKNPYWTLRAEVAVKNEKVGWTLWIKGDGFVERDEGEDGGSPQYQQNLQYRLVFLEWNDGKWNLRGGYQWIDLDFTGGGVFDIKVIVSEENGELINEKVNADEDSSGLPLFNSFSDNAKAELKGFSGIWKVSEGGKEVFQDMVVSPKNDSTNEYGILGKSGGFEDSKIKATSFYKPEESKWVTYPENGKSFTYHKLDIKDALDKWYEPFKGKKGKWTKLAE